MGQNSLTFCNTEIEKNKFFHHNPGINTGYCYILPVQALVQIYIIADITGCKKNTKTVSYLLYYLFPIYQW